MTCLDYRSVVVVVNGVELKICEERSLSLICTREKGWELHRRTGCASEVIGGEFLSDRFQIIIAGSVVCDNTPPSRLGGIN